MAIPQYRKGHLAILAGIDKDEAKCPGFLLGGNYRTGVAFGDCVAFGWTEAKRVSKFLASQSSSSSSAETVKATAETEMTIVA